MRANETYSKAKLKFSDRNMDVLINIQSPHKWWSTLKSAVFGSSSSLPPLVSESGGLVCKSVGKADLLSDHFDISGGPNLSLRCSARVHHCLRSLVRLVHWYVSRLVRLICFRIILTASSPGRLLIYRSLFIHLLVLPWIPLVALTHWACFFFFLRELLMLWPPVLV